MTQVLNEAGPLFEKYRACFAEAPLMFRLTFAQAFMVLEASTVLERLGQDLERAFGALVASRVPPSFLAYSIWELGLGFGALSRGGSAFNLDHGLRSRFGGGAGACGSTLWLRQASPLS